MEFLTVAKIFVLAFLSLYVLDYAARMRYKYRAKKHGCSPDFTYRFPDMFLPFGLWGTVKVARTYSKKESLRFICDVFDTLNVQTLVSWNGFQISPMTIDPENIKAILATQFKDFSLGDRYDMFYQLLGNGIFTLSGEGWKHSRTLLRPQFARDQISHLESIKSHVNIMIDRMLRETAEDKSLDAQFLLHCLTLDTATEFLMGESTDSLKSSTHRVQGPTRAVSGPEFGEAFGDAQTILGYRFIVGDAWKLVDSPQFRKNVDICKNFIDYFVLKTLEHPLEKDEQADKYVFIRELTKETRDPVVIRDQAFNILLAGRDTTAGTMSFMVCHLARDKNVWRKLRQEVLAHFGNDPSSITFESLKRCKYLNNVINETLRLHPIVPANFRYSVRDTTLPTGGGPNHDQPIFVAKGTRVMYTVFAMHRCKKYWGEDANEFRPDRWDDVSGHGAHQWDFLPFNGGPRICLGQMFALTEIACTWVQICQRISDLDIDLQWDDPSMMPHHLRLTASVPGGVPSKWYADKESI